METSRSSSSSAAWVLLGLAILVAIVHLTGAFIWVAQWLGIGYSTRLNVDAAQVGSSGEFLLHLPPTDGDIVITSEPSGAHSLGGLSGQAPPNVVGDDGAITIRDRFCSAGCVVGLTNNLSDDTVVVIDYVANDSEYVDDIDIEYLE